MNGGPVHVWLAVGGDNVKVGQLYGHRRRGTESATFQYEPSYLARPGAYAVDPMLPLASGAFQTPVDLGLFNSFRDSSPDRWGRHLRDRQEKLHAEETDQAPRQLSELDYLLGTRDDLRQGALRFRRQDSGPFLEVPGRGVPVLTDLGDLLAVAARIENDEAGADEVRRMVQAGSSLGGARPKTHVRDRDGSLSIAKFPSAKTDTWEVMAWEYVLLELARDAGIWVSKARLETIGSQYVLIVKRFDRELSTQHRVGYVSALTMLEARDGEQRSYLDIVEIIEEVSSRATDDSQELWRRIAFSVLTSNTDDHLRNHGFLQVGGGQWTLSPAFDLNPNPASGTKYLHTAIDEAETRASIDLVLSVADFFRLSADEAHQQLAVVRAAVSGWARVAAAVGLDRAAINRMRFAFDHPGI
ncbi:MAG: type II toxin-antitoxin system HipA family toxin [Nitriliruptoraceae bacterium]